MKLFFDIVKLGDLTLLRRGKKVKGEELSYAWEQIIKRNNEENGNFDFNNYFEAVKLYASYINDYILIKACLSKLTYLKVDLEVVEILRENGYIIELEKGYEGFQESLSAANSKSNNLVTKILSKKKEIERFSSGGEKNSISFAKAMMGLSAELGYQVSRDITLEEYNEAKKLIKLRHGRNNQRRGNKGSRRADQGV